MAEHEKHRKEERLISHYIFRTLRFLLVKGNAESIYFNRNQDTQALETITKEVSSNIEFTLNEGEIQTIKYLKNSNGKTYPPSELAEDGRKIKGFIWREDEQPKQQSDIFIKDDTPNRAPLKKNVQKKPALFKGDKRKAKKSVEKKTGAPKKDE